MAGFVPANPEIPEGLGELQEVLKPKGPRDYENFLLANKLYGELTKMVRDEGLKPPYEDFATVWRSDPLKAADYLEQRFPRAEGNVDVGLDSLLAGLRKPPKLKAPDGKEIADPDFEEAYNSLLRIITQMQERDKRYIEAKQTRVEKLTRGTMVSETLRSGVSNAINAFKEADTAGKLVILAAIGIGIAALKSIKDWKIFGKEKWTVGKVTGLGLAAIAFNEAFRFLSKDRRSGLERLDFGTEIDNLTGSNWLGFLLDMETGRSFEKPNEVKAIMNLGPLDFRRILEIYEQKPVLDRGRFTEDELHRMGLAPSVAATMLDDRRLRTSKIAFEAVDKLVRKVGANEFRRVQKERGLKPYEPSQFGVYGIAVIKEKYLEGAQASEKWTFEEIMINELIEYGSTHAKGLDGIIEDLSKAHDLKTIPSQVKDVMATAGAGLALGAGKALDLAKAGYNHSSSFVREKWNEFFPWFKKKTRIEAWEMRKDRQALEKIISDKEVPFEVLGQDKIRVYGLTLPFKKEEKEGKVIFTIDGDIVVDTAIRDALKKRVRDKLVPKIQASGVKGIEKLDIAKLLEWNDRAKRWRLRGINVKGFDALKIPKDKTNIFVRLTEEEKVELWVGEVRISDLKEINENYWASEVIKNLYKAYPFLKGVPIKITKLEEEAPVKVQIIVTANIGGLEITERFHSGSTVDFKGRLDAKKLNDALIKELVRAKAQDKNFRRLFEDLYNRLATESENITSRAGKAWKNRVLWIVPNIEAAMTGNLLETRWQYLLDYKMAEILLRYEKRLQGMNVSDVPVIDNITSLKHELNQMNIGFGNELDKVAAFPTYLERLEILGYENQPYKEQFRRFIKAISQNKFDYAGFEGSDFSEASHECYVKLLSLWTQYTWRYSGVDFTAGTGKKPKDIENELGYIRELTVKMLEKIQREKGKISPDDIPDATAFTDIQAAIRSKYPDFTF